MPDIDSYIGLMHTLFTLEDLYGLTVSKDYLTFVLEQLSDLDSISYRTMMGEYILYYRDKIVGGIYDELPAPK